MKNQFILFNLFILIIFASHCSNNNNEILALYKGGQLTKAELVDRIGENKFSKISDSNGAINTIQEYAFKKLVFDHRADLIHGKSVSDKVLRIANDQKLKLVLDHLIKNYSLNDSIISFVNNSELIEYTIQDIVVTHRLSYSQNKDRSPEEAYSIAKIIYDRISSNKISFDEAVSIYAEHPSVKLKNGIMGPLPYGKLPKKFNDVIWQSEPNKIIGPVETKFGYHIFQTIKKEKSTEAQANNRNNKIKREIKNGRYGYLDEYTDAYANQLFRQYDGEIYIDNIDTLWQIADSLDLFVIPDGIPIKSLIKTNYLKPLARLNNQNLTINWFVNEANRQGTYRKSNFVKAYFLYNILRDILHRYCSILMFDQNSEKYISRKSQNNIRTKQENYLFENYVNQEMKKDSSLTEYIILNRLAIKYNLEIKQLP